MLKRNDAAAGTSGGKNFCADTDMVLVELPSVVEYLVQDRWEDGKKRETSTIMVCIDDGRVKVALNDRAGRRSLWVSAGTVLDALEGLETILSEGTPEWRKWTR